MNMLYRQIIDQLGLPFAAKMPASRLVDASVSSDAQMDAELEMGFADMKAGRAKSAKPHS